ncbi:MAG: hypothetical protein DRO04_02920, partial [Candidatus Iainarchaeum archaeon]
MQWHALQLEQIFSLLKSSKDGITEEEALKRLKKYGKNEIKKRWRISPLQILIRQLKSPLVYILIIAIVVSFFLQHYLDFWLISAIMVINIILGFIQEFRAEKALEELTKYAIQKAVVVRNGIPKEIDARLIVP